MGRVVCVLLYDCPLGLGVERVLDEDRDILLAYGIDGGRIDHFRTEIAKLHGLHITQFVDGVSGVDDPWVSSHETIHICPDLQHLRIKDGCQYAGCVVRSATAEIGGLAAFSIGGDEAGHKSHRLVQTEFSEGLFHELCGELGVEQVLVLLTGGLDELPCVIPFGVIDESGADFR